VTRLVTVLVTLAVPAEADAEDAAALVSDAATDTALDVVAAVGVEGHLPVPGALVQRRHSTQPWQVETLTTTGAVLRDLAGTLIRAPSPRSAPTPSNAPPGRSRRRTPGPTTEVRSSLLGSDGRCPPGRRRTGQPAQVALTLPNRGTRTPDGPGELGDRRPAGRPEGTPPDHSRRRPRQPDALVPAGPSAPDAHRWRAAAAPGAVRGDPLHPREPPHLAGPWGHPPRPPPRRDSGRQARRRPRHQRRPCTEDPTRPQRLRPRRRPRHPRQLGEWGPVAAAGVAAGTTLSRLNNRLPAAAAAGVTVLYSDRRLWHATATATWWATAIDPPAARAQRAEQARQLHASGAPVSAIARQLGFSTATIRRDLDTRTPPATNSR
jgi:hypothetical protein